MPPVPSCPPVTQAQAQALTPAHSLLGPQTLCRGGDTDTNAAIVGGLMGALHGASTIPATMLQPVEAYASGSCPADLRAACLRGLAQRLYREARNAA